MAKAGVTRPRGLHVAAGARHNGAHRAPEASARSARMPTLFRFLVILATLAGLVYAGMLALATFVQPVERDVTIRLPAERVNPAP